MDFLFSLVAGSGSWVAGVLAAAAATFVALWRVYATGKAAGRSEQEAKERDRHARNMEDIANAANARPVGGVSDDPYNRDNR